MISGMKAAVGKKSGSDSRFFASTNRKGENQELQEELRSPQRDRKRDAVKKVSSTSRPPLWCARAAQIPGLFPDSPARPSLP